MQCPNCNSFMTHRSRCKSCGIDAVLFMGVMRISDRLYNQGLERLRAFDFYHGIEYLSKSVAINKNNVPARNLLGLALYEVGHVGEALKHWIISHDLLKESNPAIKYINHINENQRAVERYSDAIVMYNKALNHIWQASDELAVIQLKKAVEINPRFVDAMNLLTLCHLIQNNKDRALGMIERVLAIDSQNAIALNYYSILRPNVAFQPRLPKLTPPTQNTLSKPSLPTVIPFQQIEIDEPKQKSFHIAEILAFFLGAAGVAVVFYFLLIPMIEQEHESALSDARTEMNLAAMQHEYELGQMQEGIDELYAEIGELEGFILEWEDFGDYLHRIITVYEAHLLFLDEDFADAVAVLDGISLQGLPGDVLLLVEHIFDTVYPELGQTYYQTGLEAFNDADYALAIINLARAHRFLLPRDEYEPMPAQWNQLLFMLGSLRYSGGYFYEAFELLLELRTRTPDLQAAAVLEMLESIAERLGVDLEDFFEDEDE